MAPQQIYVGIPASVVNLVQQGLLERAFHDGLYPALLFRGEAPFEEWEANTGTQLLMTRAGLLTPVTTALAPGVDPEPVTTNYEQWVATLQRYGSSIDTHVPTSAVANASQFLRNIQQLGLQAGQSLNRIPRNTLFQSYLSGQTCLILITASADTTLRVASINGFQDVVGGVNVRPLPVSPTNPLAITLYNGATPIALNVVGAVPDNANDPNGPGTLLLSTTVGAIVAVRSTVRSSVAPRIIRAGGGSSVDAIGAGDIGTLQMAIEATNWLRKNNVPPHEDGTYHAHANTDFNSQVFQDPSFQRLNTGLPDHTYYQQAFISTIAGITFFLNNEAPDYLNAGTLAATGTNAMYSPDVGGETRNETGVNIGRVVVTGRGSIMEKGLDESNYVTEAGITGQVGDFQIANMGVEVETERVRLILRAPLNRLQDIVAATWSITTSFACPTDITFTGATPARFRRAVILEHALNG